MSLALRYVAPPPDAGKVPLVMRASPATSAATAWFGPATLLLLQSSLVGLVAGLALMVCAARLFSAPWTARYEQPADSSRHFLLALALATGFQAAAVSWLLRYPLFAGLVLALSAAMLTAVAINLGAWAEDRPPNLRRSLAGLGLIVLLALLAGRASDLLSGSGRMKSVARRQAMPPAAPDRSKHRSSKAEAIPAVHVPGGYPGVILWPQVKPVTVLIAPVLAMHGVYGPAAQPLTIPFGGEYWMYRWPFLHPPPNSFFQRGSPSSLFFRTTDHERLQMEARQKLTRAIGLTCCSRVHLDILNADTHPGTVSLELLLVDGEKAMAPSQSLGSRLVTSAPDLSAEVAAPVTETLEFPFPASPHLDQFDEIKVIFHMALGRVDRSARISIERFVLAPRMR